MALVSSDVKNVMLGIVNGGIGLYMVEWVYPKTETQYVMVQYRAVGNIPWVDVNLSLPIPVNGIPADSPVIIVPNAVAGVQYEIFVKNNASFYGLSTFITVPQAVLGNNFLADDTIYNLCGSEPVFLYSKKPFATGVTLYEDLEMSTPLSSALVSKPSGGDIYEVLAGVVGASTGYGCFNWVEGLFVVGNTTSICSGSAVQKFYTNGEVVGTLTGYFIYSDQQLTSPVTGSSYVLDTVSGIIYDLDIATGEVGAAVDTCDNFHNVEIVNGVSKRTITGVFGISGFLLESTVTVGDTYYGAHSAFTARIALVVAGGGNCDNCGVDCARILKNGVEQQVINVQEGTYYFNSASYLGTDLIRIELYDCPCGGIPLLIS